MKSHASMNRIYRLVFNAALGIWVAVAENARGKGKGGRAASALIAVLAILAAISPLTTPSAHAANAADATLKGGTGTVATQGNTTIINQTSQRMALDWTQLSTAAGEALKFNQPNAQAVALNRITGSSPSQLLGSLTANGQVFILNPNGILFGAGSQVNVGGIVASTLGMNPTDFMNGSTTFTKTTGTGSVVNQGSMTATQGGYLALLAPEVRNEGVMTATLGTALLAAGNKVTLNLNNGSLLSYTIDQGAINALADNKQLIKADGGQVLLGAKALDALTTATVNNTGVIEAKTIQNIAGRIMLMGDMEYGTVNVGGTLDASASNGGNGGFIETSAARFQLQPGLHVTTRAAQGRTGTWLIDPTDIRINQSNCTGSNCLSANDIQAGLVNNNVTVATAAAGTGAGDIKISQGVGLTWTTTNTLTLDAHGSINVFLNGSGGSTFRGVDGKLVLRAGGDIDLLSITLAVSSASASAGGNLKTLGISGASTVAARAGNDISGLNLRYLTTGSRSVEVAASAGGNINIGVDSQMDSITVGNAGTLSGIVAGGSVTVNTQQSIGRDGATIHVDQQIVAGASSTITLQAGAAQDRQQGSATLNEGRQGFAGGSINVDARLSGGSVVLAAGAGGAGEGNGFGFSDGGQGGAGGTVRIQVSQPMGSSAWQIASGRGGNGAATNNPGGFGGRGGDAGNVVFNQGSPMQVGSLSISSAAGGQGAVNGATPALQSANGNQGVVTGNVQVQASGSITIAPKISNATADVLLQAGTGISNGAGGAVVVDAAQLHLRNTTSGDVLANNTGNITVTGNSTVNRMQLASSTGDITLNSTVNASAVGDAIVLAANKKFVNNAGSGALTVANGGRWLVWSQTPMSNIFGGLQSGSAALWNTAFNPASPTVGGVGSQFIFSDAGPGVGVVKASNASKTYGDAFAGSFGYTAVVAGGEDFGNAYTDARGAAIALGGAAPVLASAGAAAGATRTGGNSGGAGYDITVDLTGATAAGYTLQAAKGTLTVDARAINISGGRVYDGTTGVAASALLAGNTRNGDAITLTGAGSMADKHAGSGKALGLGTLALGGSAAANYTLAGGTAAVDISRANLSFTSNAVTKTYDGGLTAAGTAAVTGGMQLFSLDAISGGTFAFTDKNFGLGNKTVTTSGVTVNDGNSGNNYNVSYVNNTVSTINKAALTVAANNDSRILGSPAYGGGNGVTTSGLAAGDTFASVLTGTPSYGGTSQGATALGSYAITPGGLTLASSNYTLGYANGVLNITALPPKAVVPSAPPTALGSLDAVLNKAYTGALVSVAGLSLSDLFKTKGGAGGNTTPVFATADEE